MSNQWHRGGGRGRGGSGTRGGGRGGFGGGTNAGNQQPRRDLLRDDFGVEFPLWPLTSYGPGASKNNLLGGDTSVEELRWVSGATRARTGDHRQVFDAFKEYARLKENDRTVLKSMPETQLKQVFDSVDQGTMKPAGLERKIEHQMVPSGGGGKAYERIVPTATSSGVGGGIFGAFGGGATAAFGAVSPSPAQPFGGVQQQQQQQQQTSFGGGQIGLGRSSGFGNVPPTPSASPSYAGFTSTVPAAKPVVTVTSLAPQNQAAAANQFTPDFNPADPFGSRDFAVGQIPDQPPPPQYCT
ncbi:unnamed protein product [Bathycoccus prasinos]